MFREVVRREIRLALMSGRDLRDAVKSENLLSLLILRRRNLFVRTPSIGARRVKTTVLSRVTPDDFPPQQNSSRGKVLHHIYVSNVNYL